MGCCMSGSSVAATSGSRHVTLGNEGVTLGDGLLLGLSPVPNITSKEHLTAFCGRTSNAELKALGEQVLEITGILDRNLRDRLEGIFKGGAIE